ncbi:hypothetical protein [Demequina rhizosphaerae]|uniref:hypothetical protein n=1 Tax=Demequina rhizosphaerae TaxID=1638985 RepID=UPI0007860517|nr:hypothetical protein [Demequina rhizosphaerae]
MTFWWNWRKQTALGEGLEKPAAEIAVAQAIDAVLQCGEDSSTALSDRTSELRRRDVIVELLMWVEDVTDIVDVVELDELIHAARLPLPTKTHEVVDAVNAADLTAIALLAGIERCTVPDLLFRVVVGLKGARDKLVADSRFV